MERNYGNIKFKKSNFKKLQSDFFFIIIFIKVLRLTLGFTYIIDFLFFL